jgi:hypothetical protein
MNMGLGYEFLLQEGGLIKTKKVGGVSRDEGGCSSQTSGGLQPPAQWSLGSKKNNSREPSQNVPYEDPVIRREHFVDSGRHMNQGRRFQAVRGQVTNDGKLHEMGVHVADGKGGRFQAVRGQVTDDGKLHEMGVHVADGKGSHVFNGHVADAGRSHTQGGHVADGQGIHMLHGHNMGGHVSDGGR